MPDWGEILAELKSTTLPNGAPNCDGIRRKYLALLAQYTGRPVILYASRFTQAPRADVEAVLVSIRGEDLQGLMTVVRGLGNGSVDLILHSPGGSPTAAEALVTYLRSQFSGLRVIVPSLAMSAATMMACAADSIVMGKPFEPGARLWPWTPTSASSVPSRNSSARQVTPERVGLGTQVLGVGR